MQTSSSDLFDFGPRGTPSDDIFCLRPTTIPQITMNLAVVVLAKPRAVREERVSPLAGGSQFIHMRITNHVWANHPNAPARRGAGPILITCGSGPCDPQITDHTWLAWMPPPPSPPTPPSTLHSRWQGSTQQAAAPSRCMGNNPDLSLYIHRPSVAL